MGVHHEDSHDPTFSGCRRAQVLQTRTTDSEDICYSETLQVKLTHVFPVSVSDLFWANPVHFWGCSTCFKHRVSVLRAVPLSVKFERTLLLKMTCKNLRLEYQSAGKEQLPLPDGTDCRAVIFFFCGCDSAADSQSNGLFFRTPYLKNALRDFLHMFHKCPL